MSGTAALFISRWDHKDIHQHIHKFGSEAANRTLCASHSKTIYCTRSYYGTDELFPAFDKESGRLQQPYLYLSMVEFEWWGYLLRQSSDTLDGYGSNSDPDEVTEDYSITERQRTMDSFPYCAAELQEFLAKYCPAPSRASMHRKRVGRNRPLIEPEKAFYRFFEILGGKWPDLRVQC